MKLMLAIIGILVAYAVTCFSQTPPNVAQVLAAIHSNDLAILNTNNATDPSTITAAYAAYRQGKVSKEAMMLLVQRGANAQPQDLYGRTIDQYGQPVLGVEITGNLGVMGGLGDGAKNTTLESESGADGLFQFVGIKGNQLNVMVKKAGYAMSAIKGPVGKTSTPNDRKIFLMWKLHGTEPLVSIDHDYKLTDHGGPITFDLLTGKIVPDGGDIKLTVNRTPGVMTGRNRLAWSVQVEAVNGGIMDSGGQEAVTYAAPEAGYLPSTTFTFSTNAPNKWFGEFNQGFFVKSRSGQVYAKLGLSFRINEDPDGFMHITWNGVANTNSSRNWEGDPNVLQSADK